MRLLDSISPAAVLAARGYRLTARSGAYVPTPLCTLAVHFGDRLTQSATGEPELLIRAGLEVRTAKPALSTGVRWTLRKSELRFTRAEQIRLTIEIEIFLPEATSGEDLRREINPLYTNLGGLLQDARKALLGVDVDEAPKGGPGPILRLEARFIGDLFAGRSGFISSGRNLINVRHRSACIAACDWLRHSIVPDFILSLRGNGPLASAPRAVENIGSSRTTRDVGEMAMVAPSR